MKDILSRLANSSPNESSHELQCRCFDAAEEISRLREDLRTQRAENEQLRAQVAHLSIYKPARRTEQKQEPVKVIGDCNEAFWGIVETDGEFEDRAGTKIAEEE